MSKDVFCIFLIFLSICDHSVLDVIGRISQSALELSDLFYSLLQLTLKLKAGQDSSLWKHSFRTKTKMIQYILLSYKNSLGEVIDKIYQIHQQFLKYLDVCYWLICNEQQENKRVNDTDCDAKKTSGSCLPHIMAGKSFNVIISHSTRAGTSSDGLIDKYTGFKHTYEWGKTNFQWREWNEWNG